MNTRLYLLICAVVVLLSACGGGGNLIESAPVATLMSPVLTPVVSSTQPLVPGTYKLTFSAISTARLTVPISGIDVAVKFPAGLSVSTVTGGTGQITDSSIRSGSAVQWSPYGNYSASTRTAYLNMATAQSFYRGGQYLSLLFTVASGATVTPDNIFTLNTIYPHYKVVGLDTVTKSTVVMTGTVKTTLGVER